MRTILRGGIAIAAFAGLSVPAFAHHALGGELPLGFAEGFISGLAHPVIEMSHFAFVIAVGILTAVAQGTLLLPIWFVAGTIAACLLNAVGLEVSSATWLVPMSALVLGLFMASGKGDNGRWHHVVFLVSGLLHGLAYSQSIIGSENNSLVGYLMGFGITQTLIAVGAMFAAYWFWHGDRLYANARVVGGVLTGIGVTALYQTQISMLFATA
ncbi:HupE/UreJ family protein [Devosia sp. MC532]|uniref:HupE/UreJ family protein n=1 Tax=Devosia sp. MC532 TaxID=2799788 RepID=UPI0018F3AB4F|nr:HupE/UreJ family protein [Devosia sp. MC532]MBJ7579332.1 HupE/UreJ family protein [Devosia sp. MC532]